MGEKNEKIIFLGNQDNIGFLLCKDAIRRGFEAKLLITKKTIPRCDPDNLGEGEYEKNKGWIIQGKGSTLRSLLNERQLTIISSGMDILDVLQFPNKSAIKIFIPTGSDLAMWPFIDELRASHPNYLLFKRIFNKNMHELDAIFSGQLDNDYAARILGLSSITHSNWFWPLPLEYMNINTQYFTKLVNSKFRDRPKKRIFFCPTRKNGDPRFTHYKGIEKVVESFRIAFSQMSPLEKESLLFVNTLSGSNQISYGKKDFKNQCDQIFSENNIDNLWLYDMKSKMLWDCYQDSRMICLDQFGQLNGVLGGCAREALYYGTPVITGVLGKKDFMTKYRYGSEPYIFEAHTPDEIAQNILKFSRMKDNVFSKISQTSKESSKVLGGSHCYDCIFNFINKYRLKK